MARSHTVGCQNKCKEKFDCNMENYTIFQITENKKGKQNWQNKSLCNFSRIYCKGKQGEFLVYQTPSGHVNLINDCKMSRIPPQVYQTSNQPL